MVISDDKVREFVSTAHDDKLGLLVDVLAVTEAWPSQAIRLRVADLHDHAVHPKLMMPKSAKGGGRNRSAKRHERYSVPITTQLAARLKDAARGRADDAPLLLQSDGTPWPKHPGQRCHRQIDKIVTAIGLDPATVTMYAVRHSSIVRMLLKGIPIRLVASCGWPAHKFAGNRCACRFPAPISDMPTGLIDVPSVGYGVSFSHFGPVADLPRQRKRPGDVEHPVYENACEW